MKEIKTYTMDSLRLSMEVDEQAETFTSESMSSFV